MITINICSNYNTPSFGVSLKKLPTKKVVANDVAKKALVVPATICLALATGKANKNDNSQDKPVKIGNDELYIDSDGHLTQTPAKERSDGYYVLAKNGTAIYKTSSGKLTTPNGVKAEPKMAVDALKAEIMNADTENLKIEAEIDSFEKYIKEIQDYQNEKGEELRKRYNMLKKYHQDLAPLTHCSEIPMDLYCTSTQYYRAHCYSNNGTSFFDTDFRCALRKYLKCDNTIFYEMSQNHKKIERPAPKENKSNPEISTQLGSDISSLLDILEQKRNTLSENKDKLRTKHTEAEQTEVEYNNFYRECNSLVNQEIKSCEDREWKVKENLERELIIMMGGVDSDIREAERWERNTRRNQAAREAESRRLDDWAVYRELRESDPDNHPNASDYWHDRGMYIGADGFAHEDF